MKDIKQYINENHNDMIDVRETGKFGYMYYDPNSGIVSTYSMNSYQDLVSDFGEDEDWAKKLERLRVGQSLDHDSGAIYCRIW